MIDPIHHFCSDKGGEHLGALGLPIPEAIKRQWLQAETRRQFFGKSGKAIGWAALANLLNEQTMASSPVSESPLPHIAPKAKRAISLFMAGSPSQFETWDYKPGLEARFDQDLPESIRGGQVLTGMTASQSRLPIAPSAFKFQQHGQAGHWVSELFPHTAKVADELAIIRSMHTDAINHEPAILLINSGSMIPGKPSLGSWLSYGLGSMNRDLPSFVVLTSKLPLTVNIQALSARLWSSGFLSPEHAGVAMRSSGDPVIHLSDPKGVSRKLRRRMIDSVNAMNQEYHNEVGDPETLARIEQYEMAFRMQMSVPELTDLSNEPESTWDLYGEKAKEPGTYAYNCLMSRRLAERDVRFVQLYHRGWDTHLDLPNRMKILCEDIDRPTAGLLADLRRRGLLDDTLVMWGGEFGRTVYSQGGLTREAYGRDHHPRCFSMWMAGAGVKAGTVYGETDDFSYNIVKDPVHIRDLNATILHLLGMDHERLSFSFQGLDQRLTGVLPAKIVSGILS